MNCASSKTLLRRANKFTELENQHGPISFGKFAKLLMPNPDNCANWEKDAGGNTEPIRNRLTESFPPNLRSTHTLPVRFESR